VVSRRTPWLFAIAGLVVAFGLAFPPAEPAGAASNGSWSVYPITQPGSTPRVVFSPKLVPGENTDDSVTVSNLSANPLSFELFAADAFNTPGGGLSLRRKVDPIEGIGAWIHLSHSAVIVPAHQSAAIPFVVVVPTNATPGDHVGGIVAEETTGTRSSQGSVPVNVVQAVGVRVYGRVKGPIIKHLGVTKPLIQVHHSTAAQFGASTSAAVGIRVLNRGNVVLTPVAHLEVTSTFGSTVTRTFSTGPLLPGESVAQVIAAAGGSRASASNSKWNLPWGLLVIVLVALSLGVLTLLRFLLRRRRNAKAEAEVFEPAASPDDQSDDVTDAVDDEQP
jgi:hypothetical protein